ncbi:MAG: helix-turn-helix domain-containing protein [Solirubrobacteraceae bacterium]|nr:helix-turn-helix domain-containing protein [Solirubrobacteraceae bacterium]
MVEAPEIDALAKVAERLAAAGSPPAVARAIGAALRCSAVVRDPSGATVALVARSTLEERTLRTRENLDVRELQIGGQSVGSVALAWHDGPAPASLTDIALALLASSIAVSHDPAGNDSAELARLLGEVLSLSGPAGPSADLLERISALEPSPVPRSVLVVRAQAVTPLDEGWRDALLESVGAAAAEAEPRSTVLPIELQRVGTAPVVVVPGDEAVGQRVAEQLGRRLEPQGTKLRATVGRSRPAANVEDLVRARDEALLAANVAFAGGSALLAFEETGSYRLLLPAMTTDVGELERFYEETVAPLMAYDRQYETELVRTVEAFLENDGNVAGTAQALFTHRHTVRYRLERVRELAGLDVGSSDGRERLSLGLKAMRVLGIARQQGSEGGTAVPASRLRATSR